MKLQAERGMLAMLDRHDFFFTFGRERPRGHNELVRERIGLNDEAVVAGGGHGVGQAFEKALAGMLNLVGLSMHQAFGANDRASRCGTDRLVSKTDAKKRDFSVETLDAID